MAYDAADRVTTITHASASGAMLDQYQYTYDNANRLTQQARPGFVTDAYTYADDNQLLTATHTGPSGFAAESFDYVDGGGNRSAGSGFTTAAGNRLSRDPAGNTFTYDHRGDMLTKTTPSGSVYSFTWDNRGRLVQVQLTSGGSTSTVASYTYDAQDRLIGAQSGSTYRYTVYDGATPYEDFDGSGNALDLYLSGPAVDEIFAREDRDGNVAWYLDDREGSVGELIDGSGNILDRVAYGAFGRIAVETAVTSGDRFKYAGMEYEYADGLYQDRARWYDSFNTRFVSQDPLGFGGGDSNEYRYVGNHPTCAVDLTGEAQRYSSFTNADADDAIFDLGLLPESARGDANLMAAAKGALLEKIVGLSFMQPVNRKTFPLPGLTGVRPDFIMNLTIYQLQWPVGRPASQTIIPNSVFVECKAVKGIVSGSTNNRQFYRDLFYLSTFSPAAGSGKAIPVLQYVTLGDTPLAGYFAPTAQARGVAFDQSKVEFKIEGNKYKFRFKLRDGKTYKASLNIQD